MLAHLHHHHGVIQREYPKNHQNLCNTFIVAVHLNTEICFESGTNTDLSLFCCCLASRNVNIFSLNVNFVVIIGQRGRQSFTSVYVNRCSGGSKKSHKTVKFVIDYFY